MLIMVMEVTEVTRLRRGEEKIQTNVKYIDDQIIVKYI
jgi:hypothetical protein